MYSGYMRVNIIKNMKKTEKIREVSIKSKNFVCIVQFLAHPVLPGWLKTHHVKVSALGVSFHMFNPITLPYGLKDQEYIQIGLRKRQSRESILES